MGVLGLLLFIAIVILTPITWWKIITRAGYSGWWMAIPISAVILWIVSIILGVNSLINVFRARQTLGYPIRINSTELNVAGALGHIAVGLFLASWILFVVFGFSDWPALGPQRKSFPVADRLTVPMGPAPDDRDMPPSVPTPGWHQAGATNNDQAYWDGQSWTARRRWNGAGWVDVPL